MKTYTKQDFHNPEQLTRQQVGEGYRLLLSEEVDGRFGDDGTDEAECLDWTDNTIEPWAGSVDGNIDSITYRVPLATPLPDGTVLSSNECCWSDQPRMSDDDHFAMMNSARISQSLPPSYLDAILAAAKKPKPRVYVAGAMSSHPNDFNFPAFFKASEELEKQGYEPVNPAQLDIEAGYTLERIKQLDPAEFQEFLKGAAKRDLNALQQCDAIALLPGWENSKGARAEKAVAEWLGLEVMYLDGAKEPSENIDDMSEPKQPYNSDERAEWEESRYVYDPDKQPDYAPDDPKGAAGAKKPPMHLLPPNALIETAKAMGHGAAKYGAWNFIETTVCASTYVGALGRHWAAYARSEDIDPDSGLPHLALIAANCFVLLTAQQQGTLRDDRPKLRQI